MPIHSKTTVPERLRCRHVHTNGNRCGSPCLREEFFCYYHHTTRIPVTEPKARLSRASLLFLPNPDDRASIQTAVSQIMHAIAHNNVDLRRAGLLLYSLQIATSALPPRQNPTAAQAKLATEHPIPVEGPVEDLEFHESYGLIAEPAPYGLTPAQQKARRLQEKKNKPRHKKSLAQTLFEEIEAHEALMMKRNAERKEQERLAKLAETFAADSPESPETKPITLLLPQPLLPDPLIPDALLPEPQLSDLHSSEQQPAEPQLRDNQPPVTPDWLLPSNCSLLDDEAVVRLCAILDPLEEGFDEALEVIFPYATDRLPLYLAARLRDTNRGCVVPDLEASAEAESAHPAASIPHRNSRRPRPTVAILGSCGSARSSAVRASSATSRRIHPSAAAPARLGTNEQHPRDHRISRRRQEALAPPT